MRRAKLKVTIKDNLAALLASNAPDMMTRPGADAGVVAEVDAGGGAAASPVANAADRKAVRQTKTARSRLRPNGRKMGPKTRRMIHPGPSVLKAGRRLLSPLYELQHRNPPAMHPHPQLRKASSAL